MNIYVFGNPYLEEDNLALNLVKDWDLPPFTFDILSSPEELPLEETLTILDVATVKQVRLLTNLDKIKQTHRITGHDLDLGFFLHLYEELGMIKKVNLILIPQEGNIQTLRKEVADTLKTLSSQSL